jgi:hypothetical protein
MEYKESLRIGGIDMEFFLKNGKVSIDNAVSGNPMIVDVRWLKLTSTSRIPVTHMNVSGLCLAENGAILDVSYIDRIRSFIKSLSVETIFILNKRNNGDTLKELSIIYNNDADKFYALIKSMTQLAGDDNVTITVYDTIINIANGIEDLCINMYSPGSSLEGNSFYPLYFKARAMAISSGNAIGTQLYGDSSRLSISSFTSIKLSPDSLIESVKVRSSDTIRIILKQFHKVTHINKASILYRIDRSDMVDNIGFHALDLIIRPTTFPDVRAYTDTQCIQNAKHPNIGSTGSVCLGDLRRMNSSEIPTLRDFMDMMKIINFDSAYWGRNEPYRIFKNPEKSTYEGLPGLVEETIL